MECFKVTCSRCGKEENPDCEFKVCPICKKLNMDPYPYCCQECFKADWKDHKTKHVRFSKESEERSLEATSRRLQFARGSNETSKIGKLHVAMKSRKYNTASRICRKGVLKNPQNPHWFLSQGIIEMDQNKDKVKASRLLEQGVECFIHVIWGNTIRPQDHIVLSGIISLFVDTMHTGPAAFTANWVLNHKKFMAIWKLLKTLTFNMIYLNTEDEDEDDRVFNCSLLYKVEFFNILLHTGRIHKGFYSCMDIALEQRCNQDFANATDSHQFILVLFENCLQLRERYEQYFLRINWSSILTRTISEYEQKISPFHDGEWVFAKDLITPQGQLLNHHPALVEGDSLNEEGRVAVRFEEDGPLMFLKPENLVSASQSNMMAALLMFKPPSFQWQFAKFDLQYSKTKN
ncbi:predicted protein [Chaetoceros tenuissimus]|uniref:C6H2-type domain-containing protein n=1 Tax=Chaetoceros tenuissimus TaxID=426638 RepID=A0AAD3D3L6_9STRA|nr:predicted protein [Chaetoceros tenuissimus]